MMLLFLLLFLLNIVVGTYVAVIAVVFVSVVIFVVIFIVELDEALEQFSGQLVFLETADNGALSKSSKPFRRVICRG